ncbi:hypothetical protein SKAU_G00323240 [Synaphobranchus kaupii]|uniref:Uncharacterized protein n=1 Tax=Synaphobranchus kaupii TaxID=118154 RepID=A0A9Q1EP88_SYNKA|nr:hypothetical protein SKAU_G00323240 [Synaphobranchus kaupii]
MARDAITVFALKNLGYPGKACLKLCSCEELPCQLVSWLVSELRTTCPEVQGDDGQGPAVSAILVGELRAVLRDLHCPYTALATETLSSALLNTATEFLVTELQVARILQYKERHPEDAASAGDTEKEQRDEGDRGLELEEEGGEGDGGVWDREREEEWREESNQLFQSLGLEPSSQLSDAYTEVESRIASLPEGTVPAPLLKTTLNSEQWRCLHQIHQALAQDYECRRHMMTKRFQVTLQSFTWGEKGPERRAVLSSVPLLCPQALSSRVSLSLLLATREDQSRILPVRAGPSTAVHKVLMGTVPDRGGRPGEIEPPMPTWERRREGGGGGGRRGGGGGGGQQRWSKKNKKKEQAEERRRPSTADSHKRSEGGEERAHGREGGNEE